MPRLEEKLLVMLCAADGHGAASWVALRCVSPASGCAPSCSVTVLSSEFSKTQEASRWPFIKTEG